MCKLDIVFRYQDLSREALLEVMKAYDARIELLDKAVNSAYELFLLYPHVDGYSFESSIEFEEYVEARKKFLVAHDTLVQDEGNTEYLNDR